MQTGVRTCRRCLLKDMTDHEYYKSVYDYIHNLPEEMKIDSKTYKRRLEICRNCDSLLNGMCRLCGCFVEVRAIKKINHCAKSQKNW